MNAFVARLRAASPAMWVALVGSVLSLVLTLYARHTWLDKIDSSDRPWENYARLMMADAGLTFVTRAMLVAGIVAAAAMATRQARTLLLLGAATLAVVTIERATGWQIIPLLFENGERGFKTMEKIDMALGTLAFAGLILVVIAAASARGTVIFAVLAIIGGAVMCNLPIVGTELRDVLHGKHYLGLVVFWIAELAMIFGLIGLTGAIMQGHPGGAEPQVGVLGLKRIERGLLVKAAMPLVLFMVALMAARNPGMIKFVMLGGLSAMVFAWVIIGAGAMTLVRSRLDGVSASRLLVGAGLVMWWGIVYFQQAMHLYVALFRDSGGFSGGDDQKLAQAWTIIGPIVGAAGFVLIGWSIASFAKARGDEELATSAIARTIAVVLIDLTVVLVTSYLIEKQPGPGVIFAVVGVIGSIIGTLAFAKLFDRTAAMVGTMPALPPAAIVTKGAP